MQTVFALVAFPLLVASALVACSSEPVSVTNPDAPAEVGCRHFKNVVFDSQNGALSDAEVLIKVREVYADLKLSEVPGLEVKARDALNTARSADVEGFGKAVVVLASTCNTVLNNS